MSLIFIPRSRANRVATGAAPALIVTTMSACTHTQTQTQTTETRVGKLSFENGYPSEETARKLFDGPIRRCRSSRFASAPCY